MYRVDNSFNVYSQISADVVFSTQELSFLGVALPFNKNLILLFHLPDDQFFNFELLIVVGRKLAELPSLNDCKEDSTSVTKHLCLVLISAVITSKMCELSLIH